MNLSKVLVVGDDSARKTELLISYTQSQYPDVYLPTVFDMAPSVVVVDGEEHDICLWDTAGQHNYKRLRTLTYPGTDVVLLCFSVINRKSFENVRKLWVPEIRRYCGKNTPIILVGTENEQRKDPVDDPEATDTSHSEVTSNSQSDVTKSSHSEVTSPSESDVTKPSHSEVTSPSESDVTKPSHSEVTSPSESDVTKPSHSEVTSPSESDVTKPSQSEVTSIKDSEVTSISHSEGLQLASELGLSDYKECSAKTREGLDEVFVSAVRAVIARPKKKKKGGCVVM